MRAPTWGAPPDATRHAGRSDFISGELDPILNNRSVGLDLPKGTLAAAVVAS